MFELWHALRTTPPQAKDVGADVHMYEVPGNVWTDGIKPLQAPLFVRSCAREVWKLVMQSESRAVIVNGSPGIGKSVSMINYALIELARGKHPYPVVVDLCKHLHRYVFFPDGRVEQHVERAGMTLPTALDAPTTMQLYDPPQRANDPALSQQKCIVISSPDLTHYANVARVTDVKRFCMYPWTAAELSAFATAMKRDVKTDMAAFDVAGGALRSILRGPVEAAQHLKRGFTANSVKVMAAVAQSWTDEYGEEGHLPHRLFHGFPPEDGTPMYHGVTPRMCSLAAMQSVAIALKKSSDQQAKELLAALSPTSSMSGAIFQQFVVHRLVHGGVFSVYKAQRQMSWSGALLDQSVLSVNLPAFIERKSSDPTTDVATALEQQTPTLVVPTAEQYAAVDAFAVLELPNLGWGVVAFQATISPKHSYLPLALRTYKLKAAPKSPFIYCVVCTEVNRPRMALCIKRPRKKGTEEGAKRPRKKGTEEGTERLSSSELEACQEVEQHGVWALPLLA